ncbi:hypothetical protein [Lysobacter gummosus]
MASIASPRHATPARARHRIVNAGSVAARMRRLSPRRQGLPSQARHFHGC